MKSLAHKWGAGPGRGSGSCRLLAAWLFFGAFIPWSPAATVERLDWNQKNGLVSAELRSLPLTNFLERLASATDWQIYVEPETTHLVSAKFREQPVGEALRLLLGNLSFALVPQANAPPKLFVFRTAMEEATQLIRARHEAAGGRSGRIMDELVVTLKPGQNIDDLARALGAKVTGSAKELNTYRLKFADEAAARNAHDTLKNNSTVSSVDYNYWVSRPGEVNGLALGSLPSFNLQAKPVGEGGQIVVGLIDTAVQSLGKEFDALVLKSISVAGEAQVPDGDPTHGTAMAETILKGSAQILPNGQATAIRILPVDVYGNNAQTTTFDVAVGTYRAVNAGAGIINYSLGGEGDSAFLHEVIKKAKEQGVIFVGAAGNTPGTANTVPAYYPEVIAVTAGDRQGNVASYANSGSFVDGMASGNSLVSYQNRSYLITGTSAAAAYVSGYAAALADKSGKPASEVVAQLLQLIGIKKP